MYSYEERIRAVKLYIKLGRRLGATLRKLGYPTKNSLISWYREYEREQDLQLHYSRASGKYSAEQKQLAVQHYLDHDQCIASTLRALGYPLVQRDEDQDILGFTEPHRIPGKPWNLCLTSPSFTPHPRWLSFTSARTTRCTCQVTAL